MPVGVGVAVAVVGPRDGVREGGVAVEVGGAVGAHGDRLDRPVQGVVEGDGDGRPALDLAGRPVEHGQVGELFARPRRSRRPRPAQTS